MDVETPFAEDAAEAAETHVDGGVNADAERARSGDPSRRVSFSERVDVKVIPMKVQIPLAIAQQMQMGPADAAAEGGAAVAAGAKEKPTKFFAHSLGAVPNATMTGQPYYLSVFETRESSISFKECKNVCSEYIDFCVSLNKKRARQRAGDEHITADNIDVGESFTHNATLQDITDLSLNDWGTSRAWDERKTIVRTFATTALQKAVSVASAHLNHPGVKEVGTFSRLSLNGSYGSLEEGLFIHVWHSCSQAKRLSLCFQRISQALFDGYISSTVAAPVVSLFSFRGSCVMVIPCVPLIDAIPVTVNQTQTPTLSHFAAQLAAALGLTTAQQQQQLRLYRGNDGRYYVIDPETPLQHTFSAPAGDGATHARLEAYSVMPSKDEVAEYIRHAEVVKAAILNLLVPLAVDGLLSEVKSRKCDANTAIRTGLCADTFHKAGVNMRFLYFALVTEALTLGLEKASAEDEGDDGPLQQHVQVARDVIMTEMAIRTLKDIIRADLATAKGEKEETAVDKVNRVLASCLASKKSGVWETHVMPALRLKFAAPDSFTVPLSPSLIKQVAARLQQKLGFQYKSDELRFTGFSGKVVGCSLFQVPAVARFIIFGDDRHSVAASAAADDGSGFDIDARRVEAMQQLTRRRSSVMLSPSGTHTTESASDFGAFAPSMVFDAAGADSGLGDGSFSLRRTASFMSRKEIALGMLAMEEPWRAMLDAAGASSGVTVPASALPTLHTLIYSLSRRIVVATVIQEKQMAQDACRELFDVLNNRHPVQVQVQQLHATAAAAAATAAATKSSKTSGAAAPSASSAPHGPPKMNVVHESVTFAGASAILFDAVPAGRALIGNDHHNVLRAVAKQAVDNWYVAERIRTLGQSMNDPGTMIDSFRYGRKAYWVDPTLRPKYFWFLLEATKGLNAGDNAPDMRELVLLAVKYCANHPDLRKALVLQCRKVTTALVAAQDIDSCQQLKDVGIQSLVLHERVFGGSAAQTGVAIVHMVDVALHAHLKKLSSGNARELKKFHNIALSLGAKTEDEMLEILKSESFLALLGTMVSALLQHGEHQAAQHAMHHALAFSGGRELQKSIATSQAELQARALNLILRMVRRRRMKGEWNVERLQESEASHRRGLEVLWLEATFALRLRTCELLEESRRREVFKLERIVRRRMEETLWRDRYEVRRLGRLQEKHVENVLRRENKQRTARELAAQREIDEAIRRQEQLRLNVDAQIAEVETGLAQRVRRVTTRTPEPEAPLVVSRPQVRALPSSSPSPSRSGANRSTQRREGRDSAAPTKIHDKERLAEVAMRAQQVRERGRLAQREQAQRRFVADEQRREWAALTRAILDDLGALGQRETRAAIERREAETHAARRRELEELSRRRRDRKARHAATKLAVSIVQGEADGRTMISSEERLARRALFVTRTEIERLLAATERARLRQRAAARRRYLGQNGSDDDDAATADDESADDGGCGRDLDTKSAAEQRLAARARRDVEAAENDARRELLLEAAEVRRNMHHSFHQVIGVLHTKFVTEQHHRRIAEIEQRRAEQDAQWKRERKAAQTARGLRRAVAALEDAESEHRRAIVEQSRSEARTLARDHGTPILLRRKLLKRSKPAAAVESAPPPHFVEQHQQLFDARSVRLRRQQDAEHRALIETESSRFSAIVRLFVQQRRQLTNRSAAAALAAPTGDEGGLDRQQAALKHAQDLRDAQRLAAMARRRLEALLGEERSTRRQLEQVALQTHPSVWHLTVAGDGDFATMIEAFRRAFRHVESRESIERAEIRSRWESKWRQLSTSWARTGASPTEESADDRRAVRLSERERMRERQLADAVERARAEYLELMAAQRSAERADRVENVVSAQLVVPDEVVYERAATVRVRRLLAAKHRDTKGDSNAHSIELSPTAPPPPISEVANSELQRTRWVLYKCGIVERNEAELRARLASNESHRFAVLIAAMRRDVQLLGGASAESRRRIREERRLREQKRLEREELAVQRMLTVAQAQLEEELQRRAMKEKASTGAALDDHAAVDVAEIREVFTKPSPYMLMFFRKQVLAQRVRDELRDERLHSTRATSSATPAPAGPQRIVVSPDAAKAAKIEAARALKEQLRAQVDERRAQDDARMLQIRAERSPLKPPRRGSAADPSHGSDEAIRSAAAELEAVRAELEERKRQRTSHADTNSGNARQTQLGGELPLARPARRRAEKLADRAHAARAAIEASAMASSPTSKVDEARRQVVAEPTSATLHSAAAARLLAVTVQETRDRERIASQRTEAFAATARHFETRLETLQRQLAARRLRMISATNSSDDVARSSTIRLLAVCEETENETRSIYEREELRARMALRAAHTKTASLIEARWGVDPLRGAPVVVGAVSKTRRRVDQRESAAAASHRRASRDLPSPPPPTQQQVVVLPPLKHAVASPASKSKLDEDAKRKAARAREVRDSVREAEELRHAEERRVVAERNEELARARELRHRAKLAAERREQERHEATLLAAKAELEEARRRVGKQ